jgi:antitoxin (DNA-binding transcriptional repressor) of toxin-antitoxin stability system
MKQVGIRELKDRLREYLRLVREGEIVEVTDRGSVVAELRPPTTGGDLEGQYPDLAERARRGTLRLPVQRNHPDAYPLLSQVTPPGTAARLLDEDRGNAEPLHRIEPAKSALSGAEPLPKGSPVPLPPRGGT